VTRSGGGNGGGGGGSDLNLKLITNVRGGGERRRKAIFGGVHLARKMIDRKKEMDLMEVFHCLLPCHEWKQWLHIAHNFKCNND